MLKSPFIYERLLNIKLYMESIESDLALEHILHAELSKSTDDKIREEHEEQLNDLHYFKSNFDACNFYMKNMIYNIEIPPEFNDELIVDLKDNGRGNNGKTN